LNKQKLGYKIYNHGILKITDLEKLYNSAEYLIYPSLTESFGLGLIEAILYDCKVLASDLNYVNSVCKPSLKFDPNSIDSIYNALKMTTTTNLDKSYLTTSNKINDLLSLLN
jgi:glycosyltransferase involved in cell wall biosynthesis